ncbi:AlkA N-terminal domain-containing protein [Actinocorallia libanotica]|uniref:DNA-3-methyladenine glycosylase II n=1 Tax=Actinocorallia libanotica TaxID=46162 RepID=A0ABN1RK85_9ACTN
MHEDVERCVRAVRSRDTRFDGWFFTAVLTTGIYCRPSCPVMAPKPENMSFYPSAAAAQQAGFRACKRCRPDAVPGSPEWNERADLAARAMRLIKDGIVDREGTAGLAARLGYSLRQIERQLRVEVGAGPAALARAQRAQAARLLIETTALPMADVAFMSGFSSVRAFNDTVRAVFGLSPTGLRSRGRAADVTGVVSLRLPFRAPLCPDDLFGHLVASSVPGVEEWRSGAYRRTLRLPHGHGVAELRPADASYIQCTLALSDLRDLTTAINRCRRLLDLDADPVAIDELLGRDPVMGPLVRGKPGLRIPQTVDGEEFSIRALLGQQASMAAARTHAARLVAAHGVPVTDSGGGLTHVFPAPAALAGLNPAALALPQEHRASVFALIGSLASGDIDLGAGSDWRDARTELESLPGVEPGTVETIALRALGDPDAFPATDPGIRRAAGELSLPTAPAALIHRAADWRPWRGYAAQHLWSAGDRPITHDVITALQATVPSPASPSAFRCRPARSDAGRSEPIRP